MCPNGGKQPENAGGGTSGSSRDPCSAFRGEGGMEAFKDDAVEVRTGVRLKSDGSATSFNDVISIEVKCIKDPHVIQFICREIIGADGKARKRTLKTTGGRYETTADPQDPVWNTDSAAKPTPYYEAGGISRADPGSLTIFDQPGLLPGPGETWRATFRSYVICDGTVLREVAWTRSQKDGDSPEYSVSVAKRNKLPDWANKLLKDQGYHAVP